MENTGITGPPGVTNNPGPVGEAFRVIGITKEGEQILSILPPNMDDLVRNITETIYIVDNSWIYLFLIGVFGYLCLLGMLFSYFSIN